MQRIWRPIIGVLTSTHGIAREITDTAVRAALKPYEFYPFRIRAGRYGGSEHFAVCTSGGNV